MTENFESILEELEQGWQSLRRHWQETGDVWNDSTSQRFEKEFWQLLEIEMTATLREMEKLTDVVSQAKQSVQ